MNALVEYTYANGDLLEKPNTYFYSAYQGESFVLAWADSRADCLAACSTADATDLSTNDERNSEISPTGSYLQKLTALLTAKDIPVADRKNLDAILRNFEAKKRLYQDYNPGFTSKDRTDYRELGLYVVFADLMVGAYRKWQELPYLNALIKCMDILCAHCTELLVSEKLKMRNLIDAEAEYVNQLEHRLGVKKS
jgi:hypothetical protein